MWGKKDKPQLLQREPRRFWYLLSAAACVAILVVALRGELGMYIHPRYQLFTVGMALVGAVLSALAAWQYRYKGQTNIEYTSLPQLVWLFTRWLLAPSVWVPLLVIVVIVSVPAQPLLSAAADRRQLKDYEQQYIQNAPWFHKPETVYQLASVIRLEHGLQAQLGKNFMLSGFVQADPDPNIFRLSRFTLACCVVDARPVAIAVYFPDWRDEFQPDRWVGVTGKLELITTGAGHRPVLAPTGISEVAQPKDPYDYL